MKKIILGALALVILPISVGAQEYTYESDALQENNWYATAGTQFGIPSNKAGKLIGAGEIGVGYFLNKYAGFEFSLTSGKTHFMEDADGVMYGADVSHKAYLFGARSFARFNLLTDVGLGFSYYNLLGDDVVGYISSASALNMHAGLQAVYNISPNISLYATPSFVLQSSFYEVTDNSKLEGKFNLSLGVTYSFNSKYKNMKRVNNYSKYEKMSQAIAEMTDKMDDMKAELEEKGVSSEVVEKIEAIAEKVLANECETSNSLDVNIMFNEYDTTLSVVALKKIKDISSWMSNNEATVEISAYCEDNVDANFSNEIRIKRAEAIKSVMVNDCKIAEDRVNIVSPADRGNNKMGAYAVVTSIFE